MPNPLAVGLFRLPDDSLAGRRRRIRVEIALRANREGYALLETFDVSRSPHDLDDALNAIRVLAEQQDLRAILLHGDLDPDKVDDLARTYALMTIRILDQES